jgi:Flp pilus assembly protein TadG
MPLFSFNFRSIAFYRDRNAAAAVEFAIILPFLVLLSSGVYEWSRAISASRHLTNAANSISGILATNTTGTVTYQDLHYAYDSTMLAFPEVLSDSANKGVTWNNDISISMAGVGFTPLVPLCTSHCTYVATLSWTAASSQRHCGTILASASDTAQPTPTTLPADLFVGVPQSSGGNAPPPFAVIVDLTYSWSPLIFKSLISPIVFKRSAYINPRYTTQLTYSVVSGDDGFGQKCLLP